MSDILTRYKGTIPEVSVYFKGRSAVCRHPRLGEFVIVASDDVKLERVWNHMMAETDLNYERVQNVAIFEQEKVKKTS